MAGRLVGIARHAARRAPMEELDAVLVTTAAGLEGDYRGAKFPNRRVTVLSREGWEAALADLAARTGAAPPPLPWTTRRANLLVEGVALPKAPGGIVRIGPVVLEITYPTQPCARMEEAHAGLLKALHPDWRGGITTRVKEGGRLKIGDDVEVLHAPPERRIRLPG